MITDRSAPPPVAGPAPAGPSRHVTGSPAAGRAGRTGGGTPSLVARRPGLRVAGVPVAPLVAAEVLLAAGAVGVARRDVPGGLAAAGCLVALALLLVRTGGRPLGRDLAARVAAARRRRRLAAAAPDAAAAVLGPVAALAPSAAVTSVDLRPGSPLGVLADDGGWTAVLAVGPDDEVLDAAGPPRVLPGDVLAAALAVDDVRLAAVQVLVHVAAAPDHRLPPTAPAVVAYAELPPPAVPAARHTYVALRLEPATGGDAVAARGGGTPGAAGALRRAALQLTDRLESAGVPAGPVAPQTLPALVGMLAGAAAGTTAPAETRTVLRLPGAEHVTYRVEGWPAGPAPVAALTGLATTLPAPATTVAVTLAPDGDQVVVRGHLRTADASAENAARSAQVLRDAAAGAGLGLRRLDGDHGPGLLATLPRTAGAGAVDGAGHLAAAAAGGTGGLVDVPLPGAGVTAGHDAHGPVPLRLFRSRPTQVALVTSSYVARLLALRAQAVGALVEVSSSRPDTWLPVVTAAPAGRAALVAAGAPLPAAPMLLRCDDLGPAGAATRPDVGPGQARFTVTDFLPATAVAGLHGYDLVVVQRVRTDVLGPLATAFGLADDVRAALAGLPDDVVALLGSGVPPRFVRLVPTPAETRLLGPVVRHEG